MKTIILAAGRGSRMGSLTEALPKCMVILQGKPLLDRQIQSLHAAGISEIAVVTGYQQECVQAKGITQRFFNPQWEKTNMVRSLQTASSWLSAENCIVSYGDIFYETAAVNSLKHSHADIALTYDVNFLELWKARNSNPLDDLETFKLDETSHLITIGEKPKALDEIEGQYMGLLRFTPKGWQKVEAVLSDIPKEAVDRLDMTSLLRRLLAENMRIEAIPYRGAWGEVDNASDLALYESTVTGAA